MSVNLKLSNGEEITFTGDAAQRVLQQYKDHVAGGIKAALSYNNDSGLTEYKEFRCICGLEIGQTTETEVTGRECKTIDCIADYEG